jgi:hypothetical protein
MEIINSTGPKGWAKISEDLNNRLGSISKTSKQCRERWVNKLDPENMKSSWTAHEENLLFDTHRKLGNKWATISLLLKGRTPSAIKNFFYSSVRKNVRKYNKEHFLDQKIKISINEILERPEIAKFFVRSCKKKVNFTELEEMLENAKARNREIEEDINKNESLNGNWNEMQNFLRVYQILLTGFYSNNLEV